MRRVGRIQDGYMYAVMHQPPPLKILHSPLVCACDDRLTLYFPGVFFAGGSSGSSSELLPLISSPVDSWPIIMKLSDTIRLVTLSLFNVWKEIWGFNRMFCFLRNEAIYNGSTLGVMDTICEFTNIYQQQIHVINL